MSEESVPLRQGTLVGDGMLPDRFRVRQPLGRGAHGQVYLAWDRLHERDVALKFLELGGQERQAALHEARALARVRHPNVVAIYELVHQEDPPYLVMEYVEGDALEELLGGDRATDPARIIAVGRAVTAALVASHAAGVLHRDIKASNVVVGDGVVKLIDFGVALRAPAGGGAGLAGERAGVIGTPLCLAPELLEGAEPDERADIYAVGVLLYRMATGRYPFEAETVDQLRRQHTAHPPDLRQRRPDIPAPLAEVVGRCLVPREQRYPSANALLRALERAGQVGARSLPPAPYLGLVAFTAADRGVFFGREEEVARVLGRLRVASTVALVGASGAGKSSLAMAGVVPAVKAGELDESRTWRARRLSPGAHPLSALGHLLAAALERDPGEVEQELHRAPDRWWRMVQDPVSGRRAGEPVGLLLVVDQLEQLVTLCRDEAERDALGQALQGSLHAGPAVRVLITARDDFLARLGLVQGLSDALETIHLVRPLDGEALRAAVVEPARAFGFSFGDRAMAERIVEELSGRSGTMPLLGFAMQRLWEERDEERRVIPSAALERVGGIGGALAQTADGVVEGLRIDGLLHEARGVLLELVTPEGTKRTRSLEDLLAATGEGAAGRLVVERLRAARLVTGGDGALELAHEALVREWARLGRWIEESRSRRQLGADAGLAARRWEARGRAKDLLWRGEVLQEARALLDAGQRLEPTTASFIAASQGHARWQRRLRRLALAAMLVVAALVGGIYVRGLARERDLARREAAAQRLAARARQGEARAERGRGRAVEARQRLLEAWVKERQQLVADMDRAGDSALREHILRRLSREGPPGVRVTRPTRGVEVCLFGPARDLSMAGDWQQKTSPVAKMLVGRGYRVGCQYPYVRRAFLGASRDGVLQHAGLAPAALDRLTRMLRVQLPRMRVRRVPTGRLFRTVDILLPD